MDTEYITFSTVVILILSTIMVITYVKKKNKKYDENNNKAILDDIRASLEKQIYTLNDRLILSEERWKDVNHLLLNKNQIIEKGADFSSVPYNKFIRSHGLRENDLIVDPQQIFVLTPFNPVFYNTFFAIKEACDSLGYICKRGDERKIEGDLFPEMLKLITSSGIIIANVSGRNPNVMYELGIAHALGKHVILISNSPEELPIDIKSKQFLIYRDLNNLKELLRSELLNLPKV